MKALDAVAFAAELRTLCTRYGGFLMATGNENADILFAEYQPPDDLYLYVDTHSVMTGKTYHHQFNWEGVHSVQGTTPTKPTSGLAGHP